jgi:hypothetical protein
MVLLKAKAIQQSSSKSLLETSTRLSVAWINRVQEYVGRLVQCTLSLA